MGSESLFGSCNLERSDFEEAVQHSPLTRDWLGSASVLLVALSLHAVLFWLQGQHRLAIGCGVVAAGCAAAHAVPERLAGAWYRRTPASARNMQFSSTAQGLIVASSLGGRLHPWRSLAGYLVTPHLILLWIDQTHYLLVPLRAFESRDRERLLAKLSHEVAWSPAPSRAFRAAAWILSAALLSYFVWEWLAPRTVELHTNFEPRQIDRSGAGSGDTLQIHLAG